MDKKHQFITIGFTNSRRVKFWENALQQKNCKHELITYEQVLKNNLPKITEPTTLRITSPGEDFNIHKKLLALGGYLNANDLVFHKGLIYPNNYWYKGWCIVLERIASFIEENPLLKVMNSPAAIQLVFHKLNTQKFLAENSIRTPQLIIGKISDYDALITELEERNINQVFIKPYHGSSASGVMAFRQSKGRQVLYTTISLQANGQLYNHLQLQKYTSIADIKTIINTMIPTGLLVEKWIRKKRFQEKSIDFRILIIRGKAIFIVPRMSQHFITNLHLGNEKGDITAVEKEWGKPLIEAAKSLAVQAVKKINNLFYAGVDVAISNNGAPYLLEINAFGDMLLNINRNNKNTYEYELEEWGRVIVD